MGVEVASHFAVQILHSLDQLIQQVNVCAKVYKMLHAVEIQEETFAIEEVHSVLTVSTLWPSQQIETWIKKDTL